MKLALNALVLPVALAMVAAAQEKEVRGAPLNPPAKEQAPGTAGAATPPGAPIRAIPQEQFDRLREFEGEGALFAFPATHDGKHLRVTFRALGSYDYIEPDPKELRAAKDPKVLLEGKIPAEITALHGKPVVVMGFMVPIDVTSKGEVIEFALTQNQNFCCYGIPPAINEIIMVRMAKGKTAPYAYDMPIAVYGTFEAGEETEDGYILSIYRMTGTEVIDVRDFSKREATEKTD